MNSEKDFWSRIDIRLENDCWLWRSHKDSGGYGRYSLNGVVRAAHRLAYYFTAGGIELAATEGSYVLHTCDVRACCNPKHLYLGTRAQNMLDMWRRKRRPSIAGMNSPRAKLTMEQAAELRKEYETLRTPTPILGKKYGISTTTAWLIAIGRRYNESWK